MSYHTKKWPVNQLFQIFNGNCIRLTTAEKFILLAIAQFADNKNWSSFPSIATLQEITSYGSTAIKNNIKSLIKIDVISLSKRRGKQASFASNLYKINIDKLITRGHLVSMDRGHLVYSPKTPDVKTHRHLVSMNYKDLTNHLTTDFLSTTSKSQANEEERKQKGINEITKIRKNLR